MTRLAIVLAVLGFGFGILAALWWFRSIQAKFRLSTNWPARTNTGAVVGSRDLENYLSEVGRLNKWAAIFTAIGVLLSTASTLASSWPMAWK
jgi:hypothetical protein